MSRGWLAERSSLLRDRLLCKGWDIPHECRHNIYSRTYTVADPFRRRERGLVRLVLRRARSPGDDDAERRHDALDLRSRRERDEHDALRKFARRFILHRLRLRRTARVERGRGWNPHGIQLRALPRRRRSPHDDPSCEHQLRGDQHRRLVSRREHQGVVLERYP